MKTRFFLPVLALACLLSLANSQCDITGRAPDKPFPDIFKGDGGSYIMDVEYTLTAAKQTDYYTEYYDMIDKKGRIDSHISGKNQKYIYYAESMESWTIGDNSCDFAFTNQTAEFFKDDQTEWRRFADNSLNPTTIGPSAMFKHALDVWKNQKKDARTMVYMGNSKDPLIRGEKAVYWRRCTENGKDWVDYFFADPIEETPFEEDEGSSLTPLRVAFYGVSETEEEEVSFQFYDVIKYKRVIPVGQEPFQLPKGLGCKRLPSDDFPDRFNFTNVNVYFSSEVIYERFSTKNNGKDLMSGYYSTLTFGLDNQIKHLFYFTSQWNSTKPSKDEKDQNPKPKPAEKIIFDTERGYLYKISLGTGEAGTCEISRPETYIPDYDLPENRGSIAITDPSIFMPDKSSNLTFLSEGKVRGLDVNIFEAVLKAKDLTIGDGKTIDKVIVTHSYLRLYEEVENTVAVKGAPVQVEVRVYRKDDTLEVLTFNVFGFTTRLPRRYLFNLSPCFLNDNDYSYLTIGFELEPSLLPEVKKKLPQLEREVIASLTGTSELNAVRIPNAMIDMKDNYIYVTLRILNRPPFKYEFSSNETDKSVVTMDPQDVQGLETFDNCAQSCLEERDECWGFAQCGATCYFGSSKSKDAEPKKGCNLYKRENMDTAIPTVEKQLKYLVADIESGEFKVMLPLSSGHETLTATMAQITNPAEDDDLFDKMGNQLDDRMVVVKAGARLKTGTSIKNLGKLRYDECQSVCLDFKDCETVSYCLDTSECVISTTYASDLKAEDKEQNLLCNLVARKYTDHFETTPGITVKIEGDATLDLDNIEDCARACLKQDKFDCLSFDHCGGGDKKGCTLHAVHYVKPIDRITVGDKSVMCGHYSKKFSYEFKKKAETQITGTTVVPILNATLEECAKTCIEYGKGTCYGYDFCQSGSLLSTSCILFDSDPSRMTSKHNPICTHYSRTAPEFVARPYTNSYAGGIGFLCFLVGGLLGAGIVFIIAYIRVNRHN